MTTNTPATGTAAPAEQVASAAPSAEASRVIAGHKYGISHRVGKLLGWGADKADAMTVFTRPPILNLQKTFRAALLGVALMAPQLAVTGYVAKKTYDVGVKYVPGVAFVDRKAKEAAGAALSVAKDTASVALYPAEVGLWAGNTVLKAGAKTSVETAKIPLDIYSDVETLLNKESGTPNEGEKKVNLPAQVIVGGWNKVKSVLGGIGSMYWHHPVAAPLATVGILAALANANWSFATLGINAWNALKDVMRYLPGG